MTGGWRSQFQRLQRWHDRAISADKFIDRLDFLYVFFENALHLREWLCDTDAVTASELQAFFDANEDMRLCRDLANSHKHYSISRPSQPAPPTEIHEYSPGTGNLGTDMSLVVLSDGKSLDTFELAGRVLRLWQDFITGKGRLA